MAALKPTYPARTGPKQLLPLAADAVHELPRLLEVSDVAQKLSVSAAFIRRQIRAGRLRARRLGGRRTPWRVTLLDALAYLEALEHARDEKCAALAATRALHHVSA